MKAAQQYYAERQKYAASEAELAEALPNSGLVGLESLLSVSASDSGEVSMVQASTPDEHVTVVLRGGDVDGTSVNGFGDTGCLLGSLP